MAETTTSGFIQVAPQVCPTCGHCPTCGRVTYTQQTFTYPMNPSPNTWPYGQVTYTESQTPLNQTISEKGIDTPSKL
jgi:hypothetical protein